MASANALAAQARAMQDAGDFAGLDRMARRLLADQSRVPDGRWMLALFHGAVTPYPDDLGCDSCWRYYDDQTRRWLAATPKSPQPYIARARMLLYRAWSYRGETAASEVPPAVWKIIYGYVSQAEELLRANKAVASADPQYFATLLQIRLLHSSSLLSPQGILAECATRFPGYQPCYFAAVQGRQPRWGGSYRSLDELARYAMKASAATDGRGLYARVYWDIDGWQELEPAIAARTIDPPLLIASMRDVAIQFPADWNALQFARMACLIGYGAEARRYAVMIKDRSLVVGLQPVFASKCARAADPGTKLAAL